MNAPSTSTARRRRVLVIGDSMSLAHVARAIVVARRLIREGHEVAFATGPAHLGLARQEGFDPLTVDCVPPEQALAAIRKGSHIFDLKTVDRYVRSDLDIIDRVQPDLIIGDMRLSLNISCELTGAEYWSIVSGYMTRYYSAPETPPETFPAVRLLGQQISRRIYPFLKGAATRWFARNFNRARRRHRLQPVRDILDVISSPHRTLIADLPEYAPCTGLPRHFEYIGPLLWEPKCAEPEWIGDLDPDKPTVYVTLGSTGHEGEYTRMLVTLRDAGYQVLTTHGGRSGDCPAGVYAARYAPGSAMLRRSQAVVCHGGSLTIYQAVSHGVPVVGLPTFHDQETNMDRVTELGWGVEAPQRWRPADLLSAVSHVQQPEFSARLALAAKSLRRYVDSAEGTRLLGETPSPACAVSSHRQQKERADCELQPALSSSF